MKVMLIEFANTILKEKMESQGYKRVKNGWYKVVPDVILSVALESLRFRGFRINFGIVPFSCFLSYYPNMTESDILMLHWRNHEQEYIERFHIDTHPEDPYFWFYPDSTTDALKNPNKYPFYEAVWKGAFEEIAYPLVTSVEDLYSARKAIETYKTERFGVSYTFHDLGMLVKLGRLDDASEVIKDFINRREDIQKRIRQDHHYIENVAEESWKNWEKGDARVISDIILWQWLIQTNDVDRMNALISESETAALKWAKAKKF